jgi:hypothetical protein
MTARELFLLWRERGCEWAEDRHDLPMALSTHGAEGVIEISRGLVVSGRGGSGRAEELPRAGDRGAPLPVGDTIPAARH